MSNYYSGVMQVNDLERAYGLMSEEKELVHGFLFMESEDGQRRRMYYEEILDENNDDNYLLEENGHDYFLAGIYYGLKFIENKKEYGASLFKVNWHDDDGNGGCDWFLQFKNGTTDENVENFIRKLQLESDLIDDLVDEFHVDVENWIVSVEG